MTAVQPPDERTIQLAKDFTEALAHGADAGFRFRYREVLDKVRPGLHDTDLDRASNACWRFLQFLEKKGKVSAWKNSRGHVEYEVRRPWRWNDCFGVDWERQERNGRRPRRVGPPQDAGLLALLDQVQALTMDVKELREIVEERLPAPLTTQGAAG